MVRVARDTYDAFFNSPVGYRGQYAESAVTGEAANRRLLDALQETLMAGLPMSPEAPEADILRSLHARDAKAWIDESGFEEAEGADQAIIYEPWERNDPGGAGLRAPTGTLLQIKGGWLNGSGVETRDPWKDRRSYSIFTKGDI